MKSILCICAIALLLEAVIAVPFAELADALDGEDSQDFSKRVRDIMSPLHELEKRRIDRCPIDCFSCFKMIRNVTPDHCVNGCKTKNSASDGSYSYDKTMWNRCKIYLQRPSR